MPQCKGAYLFLKYPLNARSYSNVICKIPGPKNTEDKSNQYHKGGVYINKVSFSALRTSFMKPR